MKKFIVSILCVAVFFVGLGALIEKAGAKFKSDEKALALIQKARQAIGGDSAIAGVQSMRIVGSTTKTFKIDGAERTETGETEIAMQLPDKMMKMVKMGKADGTGERLVEKQVDVVVVRANKIGIGSGTGSGVSVEPGGKKIIIKKDDGTTEELSGDETNVKEIIVRKAEGSDNFEWKTADPNGMGAESKRVFARTGVRGEFRQNELLRTTLSLLLTAPQGMDVSYTYGGETDVDGTTCNLINAEFGGSSFKLYLGRDSNLPVMLAYTGHRMPMTVGFNKEILPQAEGSKDNVFFTRTEGPGEAAEFQVRFSDYRSVDGVQLPFRWVQTVGGAPDEIFDITSYEINPANIAEKFQNQKMILRTKKPDGQ